MENKIKTITYSPQEYVEVELEEPLALKSRIYYLEIPFLLNCFIHIQETSILYFDTQHYSTLKHYLLHNEITKEMLKQWCLFLVEQYEMQDGGYCIFQLDYIFYDQKNRQLLLCKIPMMDKVPSLELLLKLFLELYEYINYVGDEEWISQLYLILKKKPFRIGLLKQFLTSKKTKKWLSIFKKENDELDDFFKLIQIQESEPTYGCMTTPFETQILMVGYEGGYLIDEKQQRIIITTFPWKIGRNKQCDYILNYPEVSKEHCILSFKEGACFIEDLGSTNGTFVNGQKLESNHAVLIKTSDVISIAGHPFTYYV